MSGRSEAPQIELVVRYLDMLWSSSSIRTSCAGNRHPDFQHVEYPNLVSKNGQKRDLDGCAKGMAMGRTPLSSQLFEIKGAIEQGESLHVEAVWTGKMAIYAGHLKKDQQLKAYLSMIFEFKDGLIYRQRNYDCYEPFQTN